MKTATSTDPSAPPISTGLPTALRRVTFSHALLFVLGFSVVFVVGWGGAATLLGQLFGTFKSTLGGIGGFVVILFGLINLRILKIPWLYCGLRPQWKRSQRGGLSSSLLMGITFAAGWTPCVGPTLGAILTLGFSQQTAGQAMVLSSGYALGLGLPFLAIGLGMGQAAENVRRFQRHLRTLEIVSGLLLIAIGLLMVTKRFTLLAIWAQRNGLFLDLPLGGALVPTYLIAMVAGLLSFLSPCVLPLVPAYVGYLSGHAIGGLAAANRS